MKNEKDIPLGMSFLLISNYHKKQLGGADGELGAAMRYLNQRYTMPYGDIIGILTDVGTEELAHMEMIAAILFQLTKNLTPEEIKRSGFDAYFVDHTTGVYPVSAAGVPFNAATFAVKGDMFADLHEDLAAEQKARVTYDNILRLVDDPDVRDPIKFLRQREINHFQRFGEAIHTLSNNGRRPHEVACLSKPCLCFSNAKRQVS